MIGVINLSPESHNVDSVVADARQALERAAWLASCGASVIDVGGRSTHFSVTEVGRDEELRRVVPTVAALTDAGYLVSIDTMDGRVARAALAEGAVLCNASDGLQADDMIAAVAEAAVPAVVPYLRGPTPAAAESPGGPDPVDEMVGWFKRRLPVLEGAGVRDVVLDSGVGYAHRGIDQDARDALQRRVFRDLHRIAELGRPVLAPVFRKPSRAFSLELIRLAVAGGATFLRAHDPRLVYEALGARTRS